MDSGEKRLNELGYKQELRREMTLFKTLAITFSCMAVFSGTPLYGPSLLYAGPASLIWGWVVVSFFTWFVGLALAEICSSFPTTGSLYFWAAHLAGPRWGPFASWCCAWLEVIGIISGIGAQAYSGAQALQMIILLSTGTNKGGGYFAPRSVFLSHLTEETKGSDRTGPIAILSSIGIVTVFGWAYYLALTFSIQDPNYLYDVNNETAGALVPAQIIYDAFYGRFNNSAGAIAFLWIIWVSYFFCGLSVTTSAARVVYALSRDGGIPFSPIWRKLHPKHKVPRNAVWLCAAISIILGLPILKLDVVFTAIISISTIGWVGGYAVPNFLQTSHGQRKISNQDLSIWVKQEGQFVWWPSCGYVIPVQPSYCQQSTLFNGKLSIMHQ
uniref:Amino acid permease/ SLC12A domain-containing protein n=1 Tax=Fagus sylvatica TaxID=28930 RepID=A0A2N9H8G7_FAGSY